MQSTAKRCVLSLKSVKKKKKEKKEKGWLVKETIPFVLKVIH